jgi:hypothetical protein
MIEIFGWLKISNPTCMPWLILGKGPTFERHVDFPDLDKRYCTIALNHACRHRRVLIAHMIDANVLDEVDGWEEKASFILMPWQPHFKFAATAVTLEDLAKKHPVLSSFEKQGRLLWYNLSTGQSPKRGSPPVLVKYFSAEAVVRLLAMAGVRKIRTLGVDGGKSYAKSFKDIKPFRGGHTTFDRQTELIQKTVKEFRVDYAPLV